MFLPFIFCINSENKDIKSVFDFLFYFINHVYKQCCEYIILEGGMTRILILQRNGKWKVGIGYMCYHPIVLDDAKEIYF